MSRSEGIERPARTSPRARRNPRRVLYSPEVPPVIAPTGSKRAGRSPRSEVRRNEETPSRRGLKIVGEPGRNPGFTDDLKSTAARKIPVPPESTTAPRGRPGRSPRTAAHISRAFFVLRFVRSARGGAALCAAAESSPLFERREPLLPPFPLPARAPPSVHPLPLLLLPCLYLCHPARPK